MDNYIIYEDEKQKIEIDGNFHNFLKFWSIEDFTLTNEELDIVLKFVFKKIGEKKIQTKKLNYIRNVPVIKSKVYSNFKKPCDVFNNVIHYLEDCTNLDDKSSGGIEKLEQRINEIFNEENIYCGIFSKKIFNVRGFLLYKGEDDDWLMLFDFKDFNGNFLNFLL